MNSTSHSKLPDICNRFGVVVPSCDKYSDLWHPFFRLFRRFWEDCPFSVYLLSNHQQAEIGDIRNVTVGDDLSWSDTLQRGLDQVKEDYILLFLDDLLLIEYVETAQIVTVLQWMIKFDANYVSFNPSHRPDREFNELVGLASKGTVYRTSTVLSAWKKEVLRELLKPGETAWDFEIYGTVRSDLYDGFYSTYQNCFTVMNGIVKGKWQRHALHKLDSLGMKVDLSKRQVMTRWETFVFCLKEQRSQILKVLPAKYRRNVKYSFQGCRA